VRPPLAHLFYYIGYNGLLKRLWISLNRDKDPYKWIKNEKINFYNVFQRYKVTLGVLEASNLQDLDSVSLCFCTDLHKTTSKPRYNMPQNTLKVSWDVSNKAQNFPK
jgi:hypothetical protein